MNQCGEQKKKCSTCKEELSTASFTKDKYKPDGLKHQCKECSILAGKRWRDTHPKYRSEYHNANKERDHATNAKYYKEKFKPRQREIYKQRYQEDVQFRLAVLLRSRLRNALRGLDKSGSTLELTGCSLYQLKQWLSYQFLQGMSWDQRGAWHIDHVKPCASFDLTDPEQQRQCFHWTNLQPLWAKDNLIKNNKWEG